MKIGIITIHNSPNYGACLQSYALYEYIRQRGNDVEIIDLHRPGAHTDYIPSKRYVRARAKRRSLKSRIKAELFKLVGKDSSYHSFYSKGSMERFNDFNSVIKLSRSYRSIEDLYANPPIFDLYISGSDQLWNPTQAYCLEPYFLTFVTEGKTKISFATSIGITVLLDNEKADFRRWLSSYNAISVREKQAQTLLHDATGLDIKQVSDPTFLLEPDHWKQLSVAPKEKGYILLFTLSYMPDMLDYAVKISKESGKILVVLDQCWPNDVTGDYKIEREAGPREWLGYIANADMVLTSSFHGTVFSIILGASNFFTYVPKASDRGSRITDLLGIYCLSDHLLSVELNQSYGELQKHILDRVKIIETMNQQRKSSRDFLKAYIG